MRKVLLFFSCCSLAFCMASNDGVGVIASEPILDGEYAKSAKIFEESCKKGSKMNCYNLAKFYEQGRGVIKNEDMAKKLYQKSCDMGLGLSCTALGRLNESDEKVSLGFFEDGCKKDDDDGCMAAARIYSKNLDAKKAKTLFEKACSYGNEKGCKAAQEL